MENFAVSEVLCGPYFDNNVNIVTEIYAANSILK